MDTWNFKKMCVGKKQYGVETNFLILASFEVSGGSMGAEIGTWLEYSYKPSPPPSFFFFLSGTRTSYIVYIDVWPTLWHLAGVLIRASFLLSPLYLEHKIHPRSVGWSSHTSSLLWGVRYAKSLLIQYRYKSVGFVEAFNPFQVFLATRSAQARQTGIN